MSPLAPGFGSTKHIQGKPEWVKGPPTAPGYYWVFFMGQTRLAMRDEAEDATFVIGSLKLPNPKALLAHLSIELDPPTPPDWLPR